MTMTDKECTPVVDDTLECLRHEILAEDIIKQLRQSLVHYGDELRTFIRESMVRGFDRSLVKQSIAMFMAEVVNIVELAETSLAYSNTPKATILGNELQALKNSIGNYAVGSEMIFQEIPVLENQSIFENIRRVR